MSTVSLQSVIEEARQAIETGAADKAIGIARHILTHYPRLIEGARLLGEACLNAGRAEEAAAAFEQVLTADPENVAAYYGLGLARQSADQPGAAMPAFERALEIQPNLVELRTQLMRLYAETPGSAGQFRLSRAGLGRLYARGGMFGQAIDEFRSVLDAEPDRDDVKVALAEALWRDGQEDEAIDFCREILSQRAELLKPTLLLGYLLFASGDPRGEELWRRAAQQDMSMTMSRTLFDILPPLRLEEPVLPAFDEAEWRAQEARRAAEEAQRAPAVAQPNQEQSVGVAAAAMATPSAAEDDFFADSWLSSSNVSQGSSWSEPDPAAPAPVETVNEDDDDALLAALLGFGDDESETVTRSDDLPTDMRPSSLGRDDVPVFARDDAPAIDDIGLADDDEMIAGDIKPFSLDDWDEEELPSASFTAGAEDESLEFGDIQPFSLDDTEPSASESAQREASAGNAPDIDAAEELGEVRPFSLEDWGLEADDESAMGAPESSPEGNADSDFPGLQPFALDDSTLESPDIESTGAGREADAVDTGGERKDFRWEEPSWRKQARQQPEAPATVEGESIFDRMRTTQDPSSPAAAENLSSSAPADFFSSDDESLRVDWDQPGSPPASREASDSDLDVLNEAIGLGGVSADQPLSLDPTQSLDDDVPNLEDLLNDSAAFDQDIGEPSDEAAMPFSLADSGLNENDQPAFRESGTTFPEAGTTASTDDEAAFSLESLGLEDDFNSLRGEDVSDIDDLDDVQSPSFSSGEYGSVGDSRRSSGLQDPSLGDAGVTPFSLADLGFTADEIADLGIDLPGTDAGGMDEISEDAGVEDEVLPFSLEDLGLSDDELESLNDQGEPPASYAVADRESSAAQHESPGDDRAARSVPAGADDQGEPVSSMTRAPYGETESILTQIDADPDNDPLRLAVARMTHAMQDPDQSLEQYRQLIRRGNLLDDVVADLQDMVAESDDQSLQRRMHRLLGDALMKQNRVREAMDAYSWTPSRSK